MTRARPVPGLWKWDLRDPGRAGWSTKEEAELLFFDPTGHGCVRDHKGAREAAETAAFLISMQDLFPARFWIDVGSRILTTLPSASTAAIQLFAIGCMSIAHQSIALTVRTVQGNRHH